MLLFTSMILTSTSIPSLGLFLLITITQLAQVVIYVIQLVLSQLENAPLDPRKTSKDSNENPCSAIHATTSSGYFGHMKHFECFT